jgi:catechol 2,3-dioxygenase-like lactoylglutathione lyase family enzyme
MIKPKAIDHVCLWVRSLAKSRAYYETVFDMVGTERADSPDTLVLESDQVHFFMQECRGDTRFIEKQHLSFEVDNLRDVIAGLKSAGISDYTMGEVTFLKYRNYAWCEWKDPDGIRLECIEVSKLYGKNLQN